MRRLRRPASRARGPLARGPWPASLRPVADQDRGGRPGRITRRRPRPRRRPRACFRRGPARARRQFDAPARLVNRVIRRHADRPALAGRVASSRIRSRGDCSSPRRLASALAASVARAMASSGFSRLIVIGRRFEYLRGRSARRIASAFASGASGASRLANALAIRRWLAASSARAGASSAGVCVSAAFRSRWSSASAAARSSAGVWPSSFCWSRSRVDRAAT